MADASLILDTVVAISIVAGTLFAVMQIREIAKDRHTELMLRFSETWLTLELEDVMSKLMRTNSLTERKWKRFARQLVFR